MNDDNSGNSEQEIRRLRAENEALRAELHARNSSAAFSDASGWLEQALSGADVGLFALDMADQRLYPSPTCCRLFGLLIEQSYPAILLENLVLPEDRPLASDAQRRRAQSFPAVTRYRIARADTGAVRLIERSSTMELDAQGRPVRLIGAVRDVSQEHAAEVAAADREHALRDFSAERQFVIDLTSRHRAQADPDIVMRLTAQALGERLGVNRVGFYRVLGQDRVQYINGWSDGVLPILSGVEPAAGAGTRVAQHRASGLRLTFADSRHEEDGDLAAMAQAGVLAGIVMPLMSNQRWHAGMYVDSAAVRAWTPREVALVREVAELAWLAVERAEALIRLRDRVGRQNEQIASGVREAQMQKAGRDDAESQVRQLQKMEAVSMLTGGIAHDFNNMLAVITGALQLVDRKLKRGDMQVDRHVDSALDAARRAATLTSRLLSFSRMQPLAPQPMDINRLLAGIADMLTRAVGERVHLETIETAGLWIARVDPNQLETALLNLLVNARDAMPDGGKATIETSNVQVEQSYATEYRIPTGHYVCISVTDTGTGMTPQVMEKAFDPFFTTKGVGKGTGLGLSQVFGFSAQSGGHVRVYSEPGHGTTFRIYLPRHWGDALPQDNPRGIAAAPRRGRKEEVILVVEDEDRMRAISCEALRELGFTVLQAASGPEALAMINAGQQVSLLFTDIVMPEMNGRQLADLALLKLPALKVLFTTGYTRNAVVHNGVLDHGVNLLTKPFSIDELARRVIAVLDEGSERVPDRRI